jgi:hypothetical protein
MNLLLAMTWLGRDHAGFGDIGEFSKQCWVGAASTDRDSAALVLLAGYAEEFIDLHAGTAVTAGFVKEFLEEIRSQAVQLKKASDESDAAFIDSLNRFAAHRASRSNPTLPETDRP